MSSNNDGSIVLALAHIYSKVAYACQCHWKSIKKPFVRLGEGISQVYKGLTKAKNFGNGLHIIGEGIKHIFGMTAAQKRTRSIDCAVATHPGALDPMIVRALIENQLGYQDNMVITSIGKEIPKRSIFTPAMIAKIYQKTFAHNFVGVQPMRGPVGRVTALEMRTNEPVIEGQGNRMSLEIVSHTVTAGSRQLAASFTPEGIQDLSAIHKCTDIQEVFEEVLSSEIASELDNQVLNNLYALAEDVGDFTPLGDPSLALMINYMANNIARNTRRGAGNFAVLSPIAATFLVASAGNAFVQADDTDDKLGSVKFIGVLNGTINVYTNIMAKVDVLVGYKGREQIDAGAFDCPYVPIMTTGVVVNAVTFQPEIRLMTRGGFQYDKDKAAKYFTKLKLNNPFELPTNTESDYVAND